MGVIKDEKRPTKKAKSSKPKLSKKKKEADFEPNHVNPKAFALKSALKAERRFRRTQDVQEKRIHVPAVDRTPCEPPPLLVVVVGPPKVGKTTLINSLIKTYTRIPSSRCEFKGPVTITAGKKRRITFIECANDLNAMIDLAKIADVALLLSDASYGFEMEVFEFLNICQVHGMPRIMGILTHLDLIKCTKTLRHTKKRMKHRFWTEIYAGAKLFYLTGLHAQRYQVNEIRNLTRFLSLLKARPSVWQERHGYILCDRMEDLTAQEVLRQNPKSDRTVALYGYLRGMPLKDNSHAHIPGMGDYFINDIGVLPDPCPLPDATRKRGLLDKEKFIYAPFSGVGDIVYDEDAVYVELKGSQMTTENTEQVEKISEAFAKAQTVDQELAKINVQLYTASTSATTSLLNNNNKIEESDSDNGSNQSSNNSVGSNSDDSSSDEEADLFDMKNHGVQKLSECFLKNLSKYDDMEEMNKWFDVGACTHTVKSIYTRTDQAYKPKVVKSIDGFFNEVASDTNSADDDSLDSALMCDWKSVVLDWSNEQYHTVVAERFVAFSSTEDPVAATAAVDFYDSDSNEQNVDEKPTDVKGQKQDEDLQKSRKQRYQLSAYVGDPLDRLNYHDQLKQQMEQQSEMNRTAFQHLSDEARLQLEGFQLGSYVRIKLKNIPCEFINNFTTMRPIIIGMLNSNENTIGFVNVKFKKHRWYGRLLKSCNPIIMSIGWRRFQTLPVFAKLEDDMKMRYLKYTPQYLMCNAHFWGPVTPQGTGFLAIQTSNMIKDDTEKGIRDEFRIVATGAVQELNQSTNILKKLKLVGYPIKDKIFRKSAFIRGMFNSALEAAKFEGASVKTVSGIRGQIKRCLKPDRDIPAGAIRATFEHNIQMSDIVFCQAWVKFNVPTFYNPIMSLLVPFEENTNGLLCGTVWEIRRKRGLRRMPDENSTYTTIVREEKPFKPLTIPSKLQRDLPYRDKPKHQKELNTKKQLAILVDKQEKKVNKFMRMTKMLHEFKQLKMMQEKQKRLAVHAANVESENQKKLQRMRQKKKIIMRMKSQKKH